VDIVFDDPSKANNPNYIEIRSDINIIDEDRFYSSSVIVEPIHTRIRAYIPKEERDLYVPNAFIYADGRFSTTTTSENTLEITVHALSLMRYLPSLCPH
jgi:hypothetical protein